MTRPADRRAAAARARRLGGLAVGVAFVPAADPAATDEPPRPPAAGGGYVWRGALTRDQRALYGGADLPPAAGWLLRECAAGVARDTRPRTYGYEDGEAY